MSLYLCSLLRIQTLYTYTHRISWLPLSLGGVWRGPVPVPGLGRRRGRAHVQARVAAVARRLLGAAVAVPAVRPLLAGQRRQRPGGGALGPLRPAEVLRPAVAPTVAAPRVPPLQRGHMRYMRSV